MRMRTILVLAACISAFAVVEAPGAQAQDPTPCVGVFSGVADNVVVPPGESCRMLNATVKGSIKALPDSELRVRLSTVGGNVYGDKAEIVQVVSAFVRGNIHVQEGETPNPGDLFDVAICNNTGSLGRIGGDIEIKKMAGDIAVGASDNPSTCVLGNTVDGNVKVEENLIAQEPYGLDIHGNDIAQNLQVFKNTGVATKGVTLNTVRGVIQCYDNSPPFVGGPNFGRADPWMGFPFFGPNQCMGTST